MNWSTESIRKFFRKVVHAEGTPARIGFAFATGVFIAWFPIFGTHTILVIFLSWLFRVSPAIVFVGSFVNNPITFVPLYLSGFWLGMELTGNGDTSISWDMDAETLIDIGTKFLVPFCLGNILLGIVTSVISYFLVVSAVVRYRRRRDEAREKERLKIMEESRVNG